MFTAIFKKTGEIVNSLNLINNPSYQFPHEEEWYADPNCIDFYDKEKVEDVRKIKVVYIIEKKEVVNFKGTKYYVSPHFRILNASRLGIGTVPESREHTLAKNWLYNKIIKNNDIILKYAKINKPEPGYSNEIALSTLGVDSSKVATEVRIVGSGIKIVDVLVPFKKKHLLFGKGVVFEIQFSKQRRKKELGRTIDRALQGFSVVWLHETNFKKITETICTLKNNKVKVYSWAGILKEEIGRNLVRNLKLDVQEQCRLLYVREKEIHENILILFDQKIEELKEGKFEELIKTTTKELFDTTITELKKKLKPLILPTPCPRCKGTVVRKLSRKGEYFYACDNFPECTFTLPY